MTKSEIRKVLSELLSPENPPLDPPSADDWSVLEKRLGTQFPSDFKSFIELMAEFSFPGEIYNVTQSGRTNGNDLIMAVYEHEAATGWPEDLVPFYGIGNGDYFAVDRREGAQSGVYYRYHEDGRVERHSATFADWIISLPQFLRGEK